MNPHLDRLAARVTTDPHFLAAALTEFAASEGLARSALAARLGCPPATLPLLYLCRMPRAEAPYFWQDVERIATHFSLPAESLAEAVRRGQSLLQVRGLQVQADPAGWLLAARDRKAEGDPP